VLQELLVLGAIDAIKRSRYKDVGIAAKHGHRADDLPCMTAKSPMCATIPSAKDFAELLAECSMQRRRRDPNSGIDDD